MPTLTPSLRAEYQRLFDTCEIRPDKAQQVESTVDTLQTHQSRYEEVANALGIPWYFVAVIHSMEASCNFKSHLHNGDPLTRRTTHVPAGRPETGSPPFSWEASAADALTLKKLDREADWSLPRLLFHLEGYNGWGYRKFHPQVLTPYLWSFSNHYTSGKYVADGTWSDTARSRQVGAAVLLRRMAETEVIDPTLLATEPLPQLGEPPFVRYSAHGVIPHATRVQEFLNTFPGVFVKIDGWPGEKTSDAFKTVTGSHLWGDPRGE